MKHLATEVLPNGSLSRGCLVISMCRTGNGDVPGSNTSGTVLLHFIAVHLYNILILWFCVYLYFLVLYTVSQQKDVLFLCIT